MNILQVLRREVSTALGLRGGLQYYDPQEQAWTPRVLEMAPTRAGIAINEGAALKSLVVYACVRAISEDLAKLPMYLYRELEPRGKERVKSPVSDLLTRAPNPEMSAYDFKRTQQAQVLMWGNAFAEIEFDPNTMMPTALWPLPPDRICVKRKNGSGELYYEIRPNYLDDPIKMPSWKIFHVKGLGFDGLVGYSPIRLQAEAVGIQMAQDRFAASFFGNGAYPGVVLKHPMYLSEEAEKRLKYSFEEAFRGPDNAHRTFVMMEGMTAEKMSIAPDEAQFLESRQFSVEEIARMYRVPPHKIGHLARATFSNIEQQSIEYVTDCLMPNAIAWEQEADRKLNIPPEQFFQHRFNELMRGDSVSRGTFYSQMRNNGIYSTNDIRDLENMNPVPDGDVLLVQGAMISLEAAATAPAPASVAAEGAPGDSKTPPPAPADDKKAPPDKQKNASALAKIAENHVVLLSETLVRAMNIQSGKVSRAAKQHDPSGFDAWKVTFYAEHEQHLRNFVRPIVYSLCETGSSMLGSQVNASTWTNGIAARHVQASMGGLTPSTTESAVIGWTAARAEREAKTEIGTLVKEIVS